MDNPSQQTRTPTRVGDSPPAFSTDTSTVTGTKSAAATTMAMAAMANHTALRRRFYRASCFDRADNCVTDFVDNRCRGPNGLDADVAGLVDDDKRDRPNACSAGRTRSGALRSGGLRILTGAATAAESKSDLNERHDRVLSDLD